MNLEPIYHIYVNGMFIPLLYPFILYLCHSHSLVIVFIYKSCIVWEYISFKECFYSHPSYYYILKPWTRYSDIGFICTTIYYFYPAFFPIAFNLHLVILIGYFYGVCLLEMSDNDLSFFLQHAQFNRTFDLIKSNLFHFLPFFFLSQDICNLHSTDFNMFSYSQSFLISIFWFFFIFYPWKYFTQDPIYHFLSDHTPIKETAIIIILLNVILLCSNMLGFFIQNNICNNQISYL